MNFEHLSLMEKQYIKKNCNLCFCWYVAMVIRDKVRQVSRGFGFVTYENPIDAEEAVKHMDAKVRLELGVCHSLVHWLYQLSVWTSRNHFI